MYVSAQYMPPGPMSLPDSPRQVMAIDDQGQRWYLTEDSQVGDWLYYIDNGGFVAPEGLAPLNSRITDAPDSLFGGPSIAQVLGEPG